MNDETAWLVSVIVPTRNSESTIAPCLASVAAQSYEPVEIIVVDRDSTDHTVPIATAMGAAVVQAGSERSAQRNVGAATARGRWLLFVDSDMILTRDVVRSCVEHASEGSAVIVPELSLGGQGLARLRALEKELYVGNENVEAPRFFLRDDFLDLGGYDEDLVAGEDWDLGDRWRASGSRVVRSEAVVYHDDRFLKLRTLLGKRFFYGRRYLALIRKDRRRALGHLGPSRLVFKRRLFRDRPFSLILLMALKALEGALFGLGVLVAAFESLRRSRVRSHSAVRSWLSTPAGTATAIGVVSAGLAQTWFRIGTLIATGDTVPVSLIRPEDALRASRHVWGSAVTPTGGPDYSQVLQAVPSAFASFASWLGLSPHATQRVFLTILFAAVGVSMFWLLHTLFPDPRYRPAVVAGALSYALSPSLFTVIPNSVILTSVVLLPLLTTIVIRGCRTHGWRYPLGFAVACVPLSYAFANPPAMVVASAGPVIGFSWMLLQEPRKALTFLVRGGAIALTVNAFWIVPTTATLVGATNGSITADADPFRWTWTHARGSITNILRLTPHWGWPRPEYFPYAATLERAVFIVPVFLPAALTFLSPLLAEARRFRATVLVSAAVVTLVLLAKGLHEPLSGLNAFLYRNVPGMWLFREPTAKFTLALAALFPIGIALSLGGTRRLLPVVGLTLAVVAAGYPIWTGAVIPTKRPDLPSARVAIPPMWTSAAAFINERPGTTLLLPANDYYQMPYRWGFYGADFVADELLRGPVIRLFDPRGNVYVNPDPNALAVSAQLGKQIESGSWDRAADTMRELGVNWILVRRDIEWTFSGRTIINPDTISQALGRHSAFRAVRSFGDLDLFALWTPAPDIVWVAPVPGRGESPTPSVTPEISVEERSTTLYTVNIYSATSPFMLVLNQTFDEGWVVQGSDVAKHERVNRYANGWILQRLGTYTVRIRYQPQRIVDLSRLLSAGASLAILLVTATVLVRRRGKGRVSESSQSNP